MSFVFDSDTLGRLEKINRAQVKSNRGIFLDVKPAYDPPPAYGNQFDDDHNSIDEAKIYKVSLRNFEIGKWKLRSVKRNIKIFCKKDLKSNASKYTINYAITSTIAVK